MLLLLLVATLISPWQTVAATCQRWCGGVEIPYPFGIGRGCYRRNTWFGDDQQDFEVKCSKNLSIGGDPQRKPTPMVYGLEVLRIDVLRGKLIVRSPVSSWCYNATSRSMGEPDATWYDSTAFRVSDADNVLTVVGCNALASLRWNVLNRHVVGCPATCPAGRRSITGDGAACNGTGSCCQMAIPQGITSFDLFFRRANISQYNPCSYAMVVEKAAIKFRTSYVTTRELTHVADAQVPAVLDWAVGNQTCEVAMRNRTTYTCASNHSVCVNSTNGPGYLCQCSQGYRGNPYVPDGCQDIDECKELEHPCPGDAKCQNTPGDRLCICSPGRRFITGSGCEIDNRVTTTGISISIGAVIGGTSIGVFIVGVILSCTCAVQEKMRLAAIKKRYFKQHGGLLLFEEMQSRQGHLSFKLFTKEELDEATNKFDERHVLGKGGNGTVYRGELKDGRTVAIKRCRVADDERQRREFGTEMLILSQVNHRNIVKLYGCCLEVEVPILVYQFIPNGTLYQLLHGGDGELPFTVRMKIAHEAAEALAYLHSTASPPIIHGDVKSPNILLDGDYAANVSDSGASALAPTDEAHLVTLVQGTCGYLDPEYMQTCRLTDKSDVYSFGVVLLELLTRRKALALAAPEEERSLAACFLAAARDGRLDALVDAQIKDEVNGEVLEMVAALAKRCLEMSGERRPSMREVAEEIDRVRKLMSKRAACLGDVAHTSILVRDR